MADPGFHRGGTNSKGGGTNPVADLRGGARNAPSAQNFFIFMQFWATIGQIIGWRPPFGLAPPPLGNPGSATANLLFGQFFLKTAWKWKNNIGLRGGRASPLLLLDPPMRVLFFSIFNAWHGTARLVLEKNIVGFPKFQNQCLLLSNLDIKPSPSTSSAVVKFWMRYRFWRAQIYNSLPGYLRRECLFNLGF